MSGWVNGAAMVFIQSLQLPPIPTAPEGEEENRKLYLREVADEERFPFSASIASTNAG